MSISHVIEASSGAAQLKPHLLELNWPEGNCRYIWQDLRGHWHLLAHVYNTAPFKVGPILFLNLTASWERIGHSSVGDAESLFRPCRQRRPS